VKINLHKALTTKALKSILCEHFTNLTYVNDLLPAWNSLLPNEQEAIISNIRSPALLNCCSSYVRLKTDLINKINTRLDVNINNIINIDERIKELVLRIC
jgi:hypothetical protein